ncbi:hypothetical protein MSAN_02459200 [Mycena sanguinolenta]|uniref:Uncharacterized protein n=1 Tax=Mycena sanguinolenta TaxID=230812 RepID=A0A8H6WXV0_9AGAR|nr:hypothetical protein MSAN_02459200 [Mycena sanguinolenta]
MYSASVLFFASAVCFVVCFAWQKLCKSPAPWLKQLDILGRPGKHKLPGRAVVCGGSIAGIITARICADHFEQVIIIDPEIEDPERPKTRILQYNAAHVSLSRGARRLWSNFDAEMIAAGGRFNVADTQLHYSGIPLLNPYHDYSPGQFPRTLNMRRSLAQKVLYTRLLVSSNITRLAGTVRGVRATEHRASIQSVTVRQPDGSHLSLDDVALVADCTGTTQAGLKWLKSAGFNVPQDIRSSYNANISYVTVCFTVPPELGVQLPIPAALLNTAAVYAYFPHDDAQSPIVLLSNVDNNMMQLLFMDTYGHDLPRIAVEVLPFITGIRGCKKPIPSWFIEVIELLCEHGHPSFDAIKTPTQSFVRYHSLPTGDLPSNLIAVGDACLQLNPIHGQGFSKAVINGMALNFLLHAVTSNSGVNCLPRDFSARYFKNSCHTMNALWDATRLHDYGSPRCVQMDGETKDIGRFKRWFERKLISAATKDEEVASALWHVRHLFASERVFLAPTVLWKVLSTRSLFQ